MYSAALSMSFYARISHSYPTETQYSVRRPLCREHPQNFCFSAQFHPGRMQSRTDRKWFIKSKKKKTKISPVVRGVVGVIPLHAWTEWIETIHWHEQEMESTWYAMIACPLFRLHIFWIQPKCNRIAMVLFDFTNFFFGFIFLVLFVFWRKQNSYECKLKWLKWTNA